MSYLIGEKVEPHRQADLRVYASTGLAVLVTAAAVLDLFYYSQLLEGAVAALKNFEKAHPEIYMSTQIEQTVGRGTWAPTAAYALMLLVLYGAAVAFWRHRRNARLRTLVSAMPS